ncbi:MAG: ribonuclease H-like domain-containing protein [Natronomonas sp.]
MSSPAFVRIASACPQFVERAAPSALEDWLSYFDPAIVLLTGDSPAPRAESLLRRHLDSDTSLFHPLGYAQASGPRRLDGAQVVLAPSAETLREIREYETTDLDTTVPTFVLSGLLNLDVDTTTLSTSLLGQETYESALAREELDEEYIHISTQLPAEYRREWDGLTVIGGGAEAGYADTPLVALDCRSDGRVLTRSLNRSQLGLQALDDVGRKRAKNLREAGFTNRNAVAESDPRYLSAVPGVGHQTAERIHRSARAIAHGEIVRVSDAPLPNGDPVYIDIETDGLNPTITWLVGVLDGTADDGEYLSFIQTDPDDPGGAIEEFMAWYVGNASHRPLVAYHGSGFDFRVLHDHIVKYCPHFQDDWTSSYRFDPYWWAVTDGNAILPGRTNTLEDVAGALGYEREDTGLTGAAVARAYQQWMADRSSTTELDWDRFDAYCEDDVRGLAVVYEELESSGRLLSSRDASSSPDTTEHTTQRSLSEW